ncbi:MAG: ROK family protein [Blastocatellia bacterium]
MPNQIEQANMPMAIGVEFNRARIIAALVDETGRIVVERQGEMPARSTRAAVATMTKLMLELAATPERGASRISSIGLAADGLVDSQTGRVTIAELKGWTRFPVLQLVEAALADSGHDVRTPANRRSARAEKTTSPHPAMAIHPRLAAIAAGEAWRGAARGKANVVYLSLDDSMSVGILANGRAISGASGHAGQVAWMALQREFKNEYAARGCLAAEAGAQAFARHAIEEWSGIADSLLGGLIKSDPMAIDAAMILRSAQGGDELAVKVTGEISRWIGRSVANLITILNPDAIVIGGPIGAMLKPHLDEIREEARRWASPETGRHCKITSAALGEKAAVIGAARLSSLARLVRDPLSLN